MQEPKSITTRPKGFFTFAQNSGEIDYVRMAYALALSLKASQTIPYLSIGITPGTTVKEEYAWAFDNIIEIPWGDHAAESTWKLENEWKSIYMSPYDETIKLDCDMLFFNDIGPWWEMMSSKDFCICNQVVNYRAEAATSDYYRKVFTDNNLPDVYTGFMYFKKSPEVYELFKMVTYLYFNWEAMTADSLDYKHRPKTPNTDVAFALALKILDLDQTWYKKNPFPTFTHMKTKLFNWDDQELGEDWSKYVKTCFNQNLECKIGNYLQYFPLHYHLKDFITDEMIGYYERRIRPDRESLVAIR